MSDRIPFMGIEIDNLTRDEMLSRIFGCIKQKKPSQVVGVNVDQIVGVHKSELSKKIFLDSDLVFVDGKPIKWMCSLLGKPVKERITGPDLMEYICQKAAPLKMKIFLLGAGPGVASRCGKILEERYPGIVVVGSYSPPFGFQKDHQEIDRINLMLKQSEADMLFVGMGSPKQDIFIYENMDKYGIPVSFSMGAALDFIAGNVKRAPRWMIHCGLEWFYRVLQDPKRLWKRYFIQDMKIVPMFLKELLNSAKRR